MLTLVCRVLKDTLLVCAIGLGMVLLWTPGGGRAAILFSALQDGVWQLYHQADVDLPPRPIAVPSITGDKGAARLSPDGTQVAFEVTGGGLYVCPLGGGSCHSVEVAKGYAVRPAWDPKTGELVFVHFTFHADEEQSTIEVASEGLTEIRPVIQQTGIQDFPDLSPDGRRLMYTSWLTVMPYRGAVSVVQQLWSLDLSSGRSGQLVLSNASDIHPRWSPDGMRIAFSSNRTGRYEIWIVDADGSDGQQITDGPGNKSWPVWSPDGSRILFTHARNGRVGLSVVALDRRVVRPYTPFGPESEIQIKDADWRGLSD